MDDCCQRLRQHLIVGVMRKAAGETLLDLGKVKKETAQVAEGRDTPTKPVKRKSDPTRLHFFHEADHKFIQHHRAAFANLKNQPIAEVRLLPQSCVQRIEPYRIPQRTCGHID